MDGFSIWCALTSSSSAAAALALFKTGSDRALRPLGEMAALSCWLILVALVHPETWTPTVFVWHESLVGLALAIYAARLLAEAPRATGALVGVCILAAAGACAVYLPQFQGSARWGYRGLAWLDLAVALLLVNAQDLRDGIEGAACTAFALHFTAAAAQAVAWESGGIAAQYAGYVAATAWIVAMLAIARGALSGRHHDDPTRAPGPLPLAR